jgi:chemotaxis signal transduction protein
VSPLRPTIVIVKTGESRVGLIAQHIVQLVRIDSEQIFPKSELSLDIHENLIRAGAELDAGKVALLDVLNILSDGKPSMRRKWQDFQESLQHA